ncbi:MAG: DUF4424 family protein [Bdellovibrionota bacterium]
MFRFVHPLRHFFALVIVLITFVSVEARANDSTATLAAEGLRLEKSESIRIVSEKLRVSPKRIVVDYEMDNTSREPITTILAFPLPLLNADDVMDLPLDADIDHPEDFISFRTSVNGQSVSPEKQIKAFSVSRTGELGRDVTDTLLANQILASPLGRTFSDVLYDLPESAKANLLEAGLLEVGEKRGEKTYAPLWAVEYSFFSTVTFPPQRTVKIHHEYAPVVGRSLFGDFSLHDDLSRWCVDATTRKAILQMLSNRPVTAGWTKVVEMKQVDYILKTGANWAGPIQSFQLTLEKENPRQIVSLCESGLKRTSQTELVLSRSNFTPQHDLSVLFFEPSINGR